MRVIAHAVRSWVERLGAVWVEAQLIEINRRSGTRTIFLTLRDKLAEVSVSVTTSPTTLDSAGPLTEGATVVARIKPSYFESSGRFIFVCDAITPIGEGRLLARLEQTKRLLQAEGLFDRSLKKSLPFLPRAVGLVTGEGRAADDVRGASGQVTDEADGVAQLEQLAPSDVVGLSDPSVMHEQPF